MIFRQTVKGEVVDSSIWMGRQQSSIIEEGISLLGPRESRKTPTARTGKTSTIPR